MNAEERGCLGTVYGITSAFLSERQLLDDVKARLTPSSRKVLEKPPFAQTPATMFGHLDRFFSMAVRGFGFQYEPSGASAGVVQVRIEGGPVHRSLFEQVRGNLMTVYDLCKVKGTVGLAEVLRHDETGAEIRMAVSWA